eukprot:jgi/Hompol1/7091/HPOL_005189-RA
MSSDERREIKQFLWTLITSQQYQSLVANFVLTKMATLVVQIARLEFPTEWPSYFDDIHAVQATDPALCLTLLKLTIEEFTAAAGGGSGSGARSSAADLLGPSHSAELRSVIEAHAPSICALTAHILDHIYDTEIIHTRLPFAHANDVASASSSPGIIGIGLLSPFKSPSVNISSGLSSTTHPNIQSNDILGATPSKTSAPHTPHIAFNLGNHNSSTRLAGQIAHHARLANTSTVLCKLSLEILHHLLSWVPLSDPIPVNTIMSTLLRYAQLCDDAVIELSVVSLSSINEALSRKYSPVGTSGFVEIVMDHMIELLSYLTQTDDPREGCRLVVAIDDSYRTKIIDLIGFFVTQHFPKAELINQTKVLEFLRLFYEFTFLVKAPEEFIMCLRTWDQFVDIITDSAESAETEKAILNLIAKAADVFPSDILQLCFNLFTTSSGILRQYFIENKVAPDALEKIRADILKYAHVIQFLSQMHQEVLGFPLEAKLNIYQFSTNLFVIPILTSKATDQEWKARSEMYSRFMQPLVDAYSQVIQAHDISYSALQPEVQRQIRLSLDAFTGCLRAVDSEGTFPKEVVYTAFHHTIPATVALLQVYGNDDALLISALRAQMTRDHVDTVLETIRLFMTMLKGDALAIHLQRRSGSAVVEKAICFLSMTIDHPYKGYAHLLPQIISFCVNDIYPRCIAGSDKAFDGIRPVFYEMLYRLLLSHWRYFFNTQVNAMVGKNQTEVKNEAEFNAIIQ